MGRFRNRRNVFHRAPGAFVGGLVGGIIGSAIANSDRDPPKPKNTPTTKPIEPVKPTLEKVLSMVTSTPIGATVFLTVDEFRILKDKSLVIYKDNVPYCMDRILQV